MGGWALLFALGIPLYWLGVQMVRVSNIVTDWVRMPLFLWLLVTTVGAVRTYRKERKAIQDE